MADHQPPGAPITDAQEPAPPESLFDDRYHIDRDLGAGGFGQVFLAKDTVLKRDVAIKELLADRQHDRATYDRYLERFQREARAGSALRSENVVTVYDLHVDADGNYYLVLEYVKGTDLSDLLAQVGTLPVERALAITLDIARALDEVHEQDIVHRDIKPANILITERGLAKLSDFGLAQVAHESQRSQMASRHPGTPVYMSPEQRDGYGYIDGRSDLYSLGLVLYEMLVGRRFGETGEPIARALPNLPRAVIAIVEKLLQEDPDDRYQSARALIADLTKVVAQPNFPAAALPSAQAAPRSPAPPPAAAAPPIAGPPRPIPASPATPPPAAPAPRRRRIGPIVFIAAGVILVLLFVVGFAILAGRSHTPSSTTSAPVETSAAAAATPTTAPPTPIPTNAPGAGAATPTVAQSLATKAVPVIETAASGSATAGTGIDPRPTAALAPTTDPASHSSPADSTAPEPSNPGAMSAGDDPGGALQIGLPPAGWEFKQDPATGQRFLDSPDHTTTIKFVARALVPGATLNDEIAQEHREIEQNLDARIAPPASGRIGNEDARALSFTYLVKTSSGTGEQTGRVWVVNHGGKEYIFIALNIGPNGSVVDGVIASVTFTA
jgi:serine/threonine-protein kinase